MDSMDTTFEMDSKDTPFETFVKSLSRSNSPSNEVSQVCNDYEKDDNVPPTSISLDDENLDEFSINDINAFFSKFGDLQLQMGEAPP